MSEILQPVADIGAPLRAGDVAAWLADLRRLDDSVEDAERVEQLRALEELKSAAAAAQARVAVAFDVSQRAEQQAVGVHRRDLGSGVAAQVGLARRDSPVKGAWSLGWPRRWSGRCRTRGRRWVVVRSVSGGPR
jgi:hypothetical protein